MGGVRGEQREQREDRTQPRCYANKEGTEGSRRLVLRRRGITGEARWCRYGPPSMVRAQGAAWPSVWLVPVVVCLEGAGGQPYLVCVITGPAYCCQQRLGGLLDLGEAVLERGEALEVLLVGRLRERRIVVSHADYLNQNKREER